MRNLHKYYYKEYFATTDVPVKGTNRHLDYELLLNDDKKNRLNGQINNIESQKRNANGQRKIELEAQIKELKEQLSVNVNVLKVRNGFLTGTDFVKKDRQGNPTRELLDEAKITNEVSPVDNRFTLQISYPGLVTGIGINHEAKIEGEFKLGVHFDWTHGMPVVYGSSVKGVLRSAFKDGYVDAGLIENANKKEGIREEEKVPAWVGDDANKKAIIDDLFEGEGKSIYDRDIFFDAVIVEADNKGRILASDSITPHGGENHDNPLRNPTPLTFMKIASGCRMEFRFKLVQTEIKKDGKTLTFTAEQKRTLFEEILKTVGVGAKTNVGYGQLKQCPS